MSDTIFALSSGAGASGIAVFRMSGDQSQAILSALLKNKMPQPRAASLRALADPANGATIDHALVLWFPAPNSYTGEDMAELHIHGGRAVKDYLTRLLPHIAPCRLAQPGEFTRRAFENGKLDLTRAEGINDLIMAETEAQRAQAVRQADGALDRLYENWKDKLIKSLAYVEATLDFVDEDLPDDMLQKLDAPVRQIMQDIAAHLADRRGERLRDGLRIAIIGAPNAGKSTLLNALSQRDVAIVSDIAGTTRDVIEVHLDLGGYPVIIADTAGLRESSDTIEQIGIARAKAEAAQADLKIALFDATQGMDGDTKNLIDAQTLVVFNKCDLDNSARVSDDNALQISARSGHGMENLLQVLTQKIAALFDTQSETPSLTRARHRENLIECLNCLRRAEHAPSLELKAEDWRLAMRALGKITGRVDVEDLLDIIFRDFCIGK